jgi:cytochrome c-type biogenesis protein CcmH
MITFWLICAGFVAIALVFILPPLLHRSKDDATEQDRREANLAVYRDQLAELDNDHRNGIVGDEQYEQDRIEIERRLLEEVSFTGTGKTDSKNGVSVGGLVYLIALGLPLLAVALYLRIGDQTALSAPAATPRTAATESGDSNRILQENIAANLGALTRRLEQNPEDSQGWIMLARSYSVLQRYTEASEAYAKATKLVMNDADLWADYAFALAMANGQSLQGRPTELIKRALELNSDNPKALELAGSAAFEAKDYGQAVAYWEKLKRLLPPDSEINQSISERIERAKALAGGAR